MQNICYCENEHSTKKVIPYDPICENTYLYEYRDIKYTVYSLSFPLNLYPDTLPV